MVIAIYNVWDGEELLEYSVKSIREWSDKIIAVTQVISNHGNKYTGGVKECERLQKLGLIDEIIDYKPYSGHSAMQLELQKRRKGLSIAKKMHGNYYICLDTDEIWESKPDVNGAHKMFTYFKTPELRYENHENYFVPGLIELNRGSDLGKSCGFYVDPTRSPNIKLKEKPQIMHHFSYVRKDIKRKIENSSAKSNIFAKKKELLQDLKNACDGYKMSFTDNKLISVPNSFNIEI